VFAAAMAEARGQRLHWKTLDRLRRLHEEELREGLAAQGEGWEGQGCGGANRQ
jgi:hypothetical protein